MTKEQESKAHLADQIIKNHVTWASGAGLIWIPIADILAVTGVQLDMIRQLCNVYDVDFKDTRGKAIVSALSGTSAARLGASMIKALPGIGSIAGGLTMSVLSGATSYAIGQLFKSHFESGGTLLDFDIERVKKQYNELFEKGKEYVEHIKKQDDEEDVLVKPSNQEGDQRISDLQRLHKLKEIGAITEEEYHSLKENLLSS